MLNSFKIENFRLFQHLEVSRLGHVNLIVGKNNSGKSTFLEAVKLYASNAAPTAILDILESRQETWYSEAQRQSQNLFANFVRHLFFGHNLPRIGEAGIVLGDVLSNVKLQIRMAGYQNKNDLEGKTKIYLSKQQVEENLDENLLDLEFYLIVIEGQKILRTFKLDRELAHIRRSNSRIIYTRPESDFKYTWQIVATDNMPNRKLAALWDLTSLTDLESEVIAALRLIDDRISGVAFVEDTSKREGSDNRIPIVKIKGIDEPLPLKSMGDGMTRLFHIVVALVNAKDGILLIDEFENGLHWTVQPQVWDIVFQLSERLNVQIFATTHSRDCIKGFDRAWNNYPELGAFFRLDEKNGSIVATEYTSETLNDSIDMDVEVR
jgi:AAA15 family ATPase/GTPase